MVITTPFRMPGGASIPVFIEPVAGGAHRFWDAGELLFEVLASGVALKDRRRLRGLRLAVADHGAQLDDDGTLELTSANGTLADGFARFVQAALEVAKWNEKLLADAPDHDDIAEEVFHLLKARHPSQDIERDVELSGFTKRLLTFDFRQGGRLIDCITGSSGACAFEVRKLLDLRSVGAFRETEVLVIVDDRTDTKNAAAEMDLVSRLATAQSMTAIRASTWAAAPIQ